MPLTAVRFNVESAVPWVPTRRVVVRVAVLVVLVIGKSEMISPLIETTALTLKDEFGGRTVVTSPDVVLREYVAPFVSAPNKVISPLTVPPSTRRKLIRSRLTSPLIDVAKSESPDSDGLTLRTSIEPLIVLRLICPLELSIEISPLVDTACAKAEISRR